MQEFPQWKMLKLPEEYLSRKMVSTQMAVNRGTVKCRHLNKPTFLLLIQNCEIVI